MAAGVPPDVVHLVLVVLPNLLRLASALDRPQVDLVVAGRGQLGVVLPGNIEDGAHLLEHPHGLGLVLERVPDGNAHVLASGGDESVALAPAGDDDVRVGLEHALQLRLHRPDPGDVVVGAGEHEVAAVAPLDQRDVVGLAVAGQLLAALGGGDVAELSHGDLVLGAGGGGALIVGKCKLGVEVPEIDLIVAGAAGGQITLRVVPLQQEDLAVVLVDNMDAGAVGHERDGGVGLEVGELELRVEVVAVLERGEGGATYEFVGEALGVFTEGLF